LGASATLQTAGSRPPPHTHIYLIAFFRLHKGHRRSKNAVSILRKPFKGTVQEKVKLRRRLCCLVGKRAARATIKEHISSTPRRRHAFAYNPLLRKQLFITFNKKKIIMTIIIKSAKNMAA
jgi:hypothetical protein